MEQEAEKEVPFVAGELLEDISKSVDKTVKKKAQKETTDTAEEREAEKAGDKDEDLLPITEIAENRVEENSPEDPPSISEEKNPEEETHKPKAAEVPFGDGERIESTEDSNILQQDPEFELKTVELKDKTGDSIPSEPEIMGSDCSKEIPSPAEEALDENEAEKQSASPDSQEKLGNEEVSEPQDEENVLESRTEGIEEPEEAGDKVSADCEDSSSSAVELSKFQGTEEEKGEAEALDSPETTTKADANFEHNQDEDLNLEEKNAVVEEPENTEFVQISQEDKHDESQIENQSIDNAEDPFGGENLDSENLEDSDNLAGEIPDFQKLGDQADNLQDVVKAKDNFQPDDLAQKISNNLEKVSEATENSKEDVEKEPAETETGKEKPGDAESPKDDEKEKSSPKEGIPEEVASEVLPGQDDELCIIPDSMKVISPRGTVKKGSCKKVLGKIGEEIAKTVAEEKKTSSTAMEVETVVVEDVKSTGEAKKTEKGKDTGEKAPKKKGEAAGAASTDVINLDDESKNSEIEEIVTKEKCKECGEEKSCKIKVKIGSDCFNVCSKECKNSFKAANNKATDIPSDGVNSKREKRCAGCLLIVEATDERNLSWETMEFCNEECLGKFQTKYGSYCRNCNGSVQAVSLGKYCVRFGYDVRQFCCSTCLEEFKKGLKVCSYCQKDISSGIEGFLAPVGDKGQFKDFCTQDCMEKYSRMSSSEPPNSEKKSCSVCQEVRKRNTEFGWGNIL